MEQKEVELRPYDERDEERTVEFSLKIHINETDEDSYLSVNSQIIGFKPDLVAGICTAMAEEGEIRELLLDVVQTYLSVESKKVEEDISYNDMSSKLMGPGGDA
jgi:hypothetical protein